MNRTNTTPSPSIQKTVPTWAARRAVRRVLCAFLILSTTALPAQDDLHELEQQAMKDAVSRVAPCVVRIETVGGLERVGRVLVGSGPTTGLIVSEDGFVISSAFNFVQQPTSILVTLPSGKRAAAEIVARDHSRMLVLLKVDTSEKLPVPTAVPRDEMMVGQWTIAVGRTFDADSPNIAVGVLSATNRIWGKAIQTDANVSPSNYGGPLIDIRGRVLGILVPLSPQGASEVAGAQWYDSGIGFAVPLHDVLPHLDKMKGGEDLYAGLLGVSLKPGDPYSTHATIAACPANGPAAKAGLQPGDRIVGVDGQGIVRQTQLKHALGGRYAGETIDVVVLRGDQRIEKSIELTDKLLPYEHPFLGVLPMRGPVSGTGIAVRDVFPDSPAKQAGLWPGDRLLQMEGNDLTDAETAQQVIARFEPGATVTIRVERDGNASDKQVVLGHLPTEIPAALPPAYQGELPEANQRPPTGVVEINIPEESNACFAYVPQSYRAERPCGVVIWLHAAGGSNRESLIQRWKNHCEQNGLILLAPSSADPAKWERTETAFVRRALDEVLANYNVDRTRIVTHGYQAGGGMAYLVSFALRDVIRGAAVVDAGIPSGAGIPENDPVHRYAVYTTTAKNSPVLDQVQAAIDQLRDMKFPVTVRDLGDAPRNLNEAEIAELVRWIDMLDRI